MKVWPPWRGLYSLYEVATGQLHWCQGRWPVSGRAPPIWP